MPAHAPRGTSAIPVIAVAAMVAQDAVAKVGRRAIHTTVLLGLGIFYPRTAAREFVRSLREGV